MTTPNASNDFEILASFAEKEKKVEAELQAIRAARNAYTSMVDNLCVAAVPTSCVDAEKLYTNMQSFAEKEKKAEEELQKIRVARSEYIIARKNQEKNAGGEKTEQNETAALLAKEKEAFAAEKAQLAQAFAAEKEKFAKEKEQFAGEKEKFAAEKERFVAEKAELEQKFAKEKEALEKEFKLKKIYKVVLRRATNKTGLMCHFSSAEIKQKFVNKVKECDAFIRAASDSPAVTIDEEEYTIADTENVTWK